MDANISLGIANDPRDYSAAAQTLRDLKVESVRLLSNNPDKSRQLERYGVRVSEREPIIVHPTVHNLKYLKTKAERIGHDLPEEIFAMEENA